MCINVNILWIRYSIVVYVIIDATILEAGEPFALIETKNYFEFWKSFQLARIWIFFTCFLSLSKNSKLCFRI